VSQEDDTRRERPRANAGEVGSDTVRRARRFGVGDRVGRYVVESRLGAGGMGVVYLAHDPDLERPVAIKIVRPGVTTGRNRLLREGQAIARLSHPNVVTVFDVGVHGEDLFIAMEYVPGTTLDAWLRGGPRPWREVLGKFLAAGAGLEAAHRVGLVHRDFKPDNVLLGNDGRVVVSDFGLVRNGDAPSGDPLEGGELELTRTVGVVGTPAYMSPEQFRQAPLDGRSDQFSFCVALWQGLFGARPFERGESLTNVEVLAQLVLAGEVQSPPHGHHVPRRIVRALRRGLAVEPAARFATMGQLLAALQAPDRHLVMLVTAGVVGVLGIGALASTRPESPVPVIAATSCARVAEPMAALWTPSARAAYLAAPGGDPIQDAAWLDVVAARWRDTAAATCARPTVDPPRTATCLADALTAFGRALGRRDRSLWPELLDPRACASARPQVQRELRYALGNIDPSGALEPGGSRLAFAGGGLQAFMTDDGESQRADLLRGVVRVLAWSPDGASLLARTDDGAVRIDVASGARAPLPWVGELVAATADGQLAARKDPEAVTFLDAGGAVVGRVVVAGDAARSIALEPDGRRVAIVAAERDAWFLLIGDVATGAVVRNRLRIHGEAGSTIAVRWMAPGAVALGGSSRPGGDEALWRLEIGADGALAGPPALLMEPRASTIMDLLAVDGRRALLAIVDVPTHVLRMQAGRGAPIPGLLDGVVIAVDPRRGRMLLRDEARHRARLATLGGEILAEGSLDRGYPAIYGGALAFARAEAGHVVIDRVDREPVRVAASVPAPLDRFRCAGGTRMCFVSWYVPGTRDIRHAVIAGRVMRKPFDVPERERDLDLVADGRRALAMTDHALIEVDLRRGKRRVLHRDDTCELHQAVWSPDGKAVTFATQCDQRWTLNTIGSGKDATVETVASLDGMATGLEQLAAGDAVVSTIDYQSRLVLVDGLPLP
jgi:predicted Ser/Thr protein kinase